MSFGNDCFSMHGGRSFERFKQSLIAHDAFLEVYFDKLVSEFAICHNVDAKHCKKFADDVLRFYKTFKEGEE